MWKAEGLETKTKFAAIDIYDAVADSFSEFDEKAQASEQQVSIDEFEFSIVNQKQYKK